jgi:hypothetical protein
MRCAQSNDLILLPHFVLGRDKTLPLPPSVHRCMQHNVAAAAFRASPRPEEEPRPGMAPLARVSSNISYRSHNLKNPNFSVVQLSK